ncbi:MAG TPA: hypothetical protein VHR47_09500, partial [Bacillota bacterium]|nr:hypothetical protein [Bacillota bacterium]
IGEKNYTSVIKCLSEYNIYPVFQDVGGRYIRSVYTEINTGIVKVQRRPFQRIGQTYNLEQAEGDRSFNALYHLGKAVSVEM